MLEWVDPWTGLKRTRHVHHPGIVGQHMTAKAGAAVHASLGEIAQGPLETFAHEAEALIAEHTKGG